MSAERTVALLARWRGYDAAGRSALTRAAWRYDASGRELRWQRGHRFGFLRRQFGRLYDRNSAANTEDRRVLAELDARGLSPLLREVAAARGVTPLELCGRWRTRAVARARHELWWRIRRHPARHYSDCEIARLFARDHSTVNQGIRSHAHRCALPEPV